MDKDKLIKLALIGVIIYLLFFRKQATNSEASSESEKQTANTTPTPQEPVTPTISAERKRQLEELATQCAKNLRTSIFCDIALWNQVVAITREEWGYFMDAWYSIDGRTFWTACTANGNAGDFKNGGTKAKRNERKAIWAKIEQRRNW